MLLKSRRGGGLCSILWLVKYIKSWNMCWMNKHITAPSPWIPFLAITVVPGRIKPCSHRSALSEEMVMRMFVSKFWRDNQGENWCLWSTSWGLLLGSRLINHHSLLILHTVSWPCNTVNLHAVKPLQTSQQWCRQTAEIVLNNLKEKFNY